MRIIIRVETITDWGESETVELCKFERTIDELAPENVGLSLDDGKDLLHKLQQVVIGAQSEEVCARRRFCSRCHRRLPLRDYRKRKVDTVFGTVAFRSARIVSCPCEPPYYLEIAYCPMSSYIPERATPELLALQAKLSALMPYRQVVATLREFLPVSETLNHVTVRNRALRAGMRIDGVERAASNRTESDIQWTLAIDGGFVRGNRKSECSSFEVLTGRLATRGRTPHVFAFVRNELPSAAERLATLVRSVTGSTHPKLSFITDGANGLQAIASRLPFPVESVLDWFHISMRVRYLEQIVAGLRAITETEKAAKSTLVARIKNLRWCFWHANVQKAESQMREILLICRIVVPETPKFSESLARLDYRTRELVAYVESNGGSTIPYGRRYRGGSSISTAMAESAVNQVLNHRMCKRQQMRWSSRGAHLLAQVRCAVINGDLNERLTLFRQRMNELPADVAGFLSQLQRVEESLPQGF